MTAAAWQADITCQPVEVVYLTRIVASAFTGGQSWKRTKRSDASHFGMANDALHTLPIHHRFTYVSVLAKVSCRYPRRLSWWNILIGFNRESCIWSAGPRVSSGTSVSTPIAHSITEDWLIALRRCCECTQPSLFFLPLQYHLPSSFDIGCSRLLTLSCSPHLHRSRLLRGALEVC